MKTTIRRLIKSALEEVFCDNFCLNTELDKLTEYILDNSILSFKENHINLKNGNKFGIGDENKNKEFKAPEILVFSFTKKNWKEIIEGDSIEWHLRDIDNLKNLEQTLFYDSDVDKNVIIINNKIVKFEMEQHENLDCEYFFNRGDIIFKEDIYLLKNKTVDGIEESRFNVRRNLENRILELVKEDVSIIKNLEVISILEDKPLKFSIMSETYKDGKLDMNTINWKDDDAICSELFDFYY